MSAQTGLDLTCLDRTWHAST